jgi:uncharacterized protein (TIGR03435 family)
MLRDPGGYHPPPPLNGARPCAAQGTRGRLVGAGVTFDVLSLMLAPHSGRPIIDETRLSGAFEFTFEWEGIGSRPQPLNDGQFRDLLKALQTQLGLTLVPATAPLQKLVVDQIERPMEK